MKIVHKLSEEKPLEAYYGLPQEVKYCRLCVISNQRPSSVVEFKNRQQGRKPTIQFDDDGICSACRYNQMKQHEIDWQERERQLIALCDKYRSRGAAALARARAVGGRRGA